jgi:hypothetical protein
MAATALAERLIKPIGLLGLLMLLLLLLLLLVSSST